MFGTMLVSAAISLTVLGDEIDFPPPGDYRHNFEITQKYDKFKDYTTLEMDLGRVWSDSDNKLELKVVQFFHGEGRAKPGDPPFLRFLNTGTDGWRYLTHHPVTFLVDGARFKYRPEHDGTVGNGYVLEFLWIHPSKEQFLKMVYAKKLQVEVGLDQFDLRGTRLDALKDFASYWGTPNRRLSTPEMKKALEAARSYEAENMDDAARETYQSIVKLGESFEAAEAAEGIKRLDNPDRKEAYKKSVAAAAADRAKQRRARDEKALKLKIERNLKLGRTLEATNPEGAISYYYEILELAKNLSPEPPEVERARSRIKALSGAK